MASRLLLAVFVVLQVADGLMTYVAVDMFGPQAEGNPLLVTWMSMLGSGPALLGAKMLACGCGVILYICGLHRVLVGLTALYLFGAVMPWLQIISALPV
jgi:hypothetical protein